MVSEAERRLFGLMEVAERHQAAAQAAVDALRAERTALGNERARLSGEREAWRAEMRAAGEAEMRRGLQAAAEQGTRTVTEVMRPLLADLQQLPPLAGQTREALRGSLSWMGGRLLAGGLAVLFGVLAVVWVAGCAVSWWDAAAIGRLQDSKAQLEEQVATLQANADGWDQAGMRSRIAQCYGRPCVRVDEHQGPYFVGAQGGYRILQDYHY